MEVIHNKILGCLLGLAAGDRIGGPIQMALTLAESLIACQGFDPNDVGQRYLSWWNISGFDTGPTAAGVFRLVEKGKSFQEAAEIIDHELEGLTAGCNPLHRSPPLALCSYIQDQNLDQVSKAEARLTHSHPLAGEGSALVITIIRHLIRGKSWQDSLLLASKDQPDWILEIITLKTPPSSNSGFTPDVLRAALYFMHTSTDFQSALERSLKFAGSPNYSPVLVGALAGARWGAGAIPSIYFEHNNSHIYQIRNLAEIFSSDWD